MSYTKTQWRNNQSPAINADNLNHIEQGVYDAYQDIAENTQEIENARIGADGVTYDTLGNAIRTQVTNLKSKINLNMIYLENICRLPYRRNADAAMQGGTCTENEIFYQYSAENSELLKFDLSTGNTIASQSLSLGHCNSMAFIEWLSAGVLRYLSPFFII